MNLTIRAGHPGDNKTMSRSAPQPSASVPSDAGASPGVGATTSVGPGLMKLKENLPDLRHPDGSPVRALVVDDEPMLADLVVMGLTLCGWDAHVAHDGWEAVEVARQVKPDVLVLDWMLPGLDGLQVLEKIRNVQPDVPALFLTAKDTVEDKVQALIAGGDDYVTKPFAMEEVLLRLHRLVERAGVTEIEEDELVVGDLTLNARTREVTRGGDRIELTATQFALLEYLMENPGTVLSRSQILDRVWNYDFQGQSNIVELYISYLRKKIDAGRDPMIHTVRSVGYVLRPA